MDPFDETAKAIVARMVAGWSSTVPIAFDNERLTIFGFKIAEGAAALQSGQFETAAAAFGLAVAIDPDAPLPRYGLALAQRALGLRDQAAASLNHALRISPRFAAARAMLDDLLAQDGPVHDSYFFMLDHPEQQNFTVLAQKIDYETPDFSKEWYEQSRGKTFSTRQEVYRDWVSVGRRNGLAYAPGKNTLLKIILKVKDEPALIEKWIEHHAGIVGYHNLIILDCGSTDEDYLALLRRHAGKCLILNYEKYYDDAHWAHANRDLYELLSRNAKYITLLDADEFLFGYAEGTISGRNVLKILGAEEENIYAGTWFSNAAPLRGAGNQIDWSQPIQCSLDPQQLKNGTVSGKAVVRASLAFQAKHIGHNLHVQEVVALMTPGSFGKINILHLTELGDEINRPRAAKHLYAKGAIPPELPAEQIPAFLSAMVRDKTASGMVLHYIKKYLGNAPPRPAPAVAFETRILQDGGTETNDAFAKAVGTFDFAGLLNAARKA